MFVDFLLLLGAFLFLFVIGFVFLSAMIGAPFLPTHASQVPLLVGLTPLAKDDVVIDIGSGDGRLLIAAVAAGAGQGIGYEIHPILVWWSRRRIAREGLADRIQIKWANVWHADLSKGTVVVCFWLTKFMGRLAEKIRREMRPGTRVLSYAFRFPGMEPVRQSGAAMLFVMR